MAKLSLTTITSGYASVAALNANFDAIEAALENTLSRDGTSPNAMEANLDMDSNRILNLPAPVQASEPLRLGDLEDGAGSLVAEIQEAATESAASATAAAASATAAAGSATAAASSAAAATTSETAAETAATAAEAAQAAAEQAAAEAAVGDLSVDEFAGDGSTVAFVLSRDPSSITNTQVYIDGVYQEKDTYSVASTTLTFVTAPPAGTSVEVVIGGVQDIGTPSDGTVATAKLANGAVTTAKLDDEAVTKAKLASDVFASQAEQEAGTAVDVAVTPGRQHHHWSAAKAWGKATYAGVLTAGENIASITDGGVGITTFNWTAPFASADYVPSASLLFASNGVVIVAETTTTYTRIVTRNPDGAATQDGTNVLIVAFGEQ